MQLIQRITLIFPFLVTSCSLFSSVQHKNKKKQTTRLVTPAKQEQEALQEQMKKVIMRNFSTDYSKTSYDPGVDLKIEVDTTRTIRNLLKRGVNLGILSGSITFNEILDSLIGPLRRGILQHDPRIFFVYMDTKRSEYL